MAEKSIPRMPCYIRKIEKNANYVERPTVTEMIDSFLIPEKGDSAGLRSFSLCGYGGIGKTQIAM
jgi:hypothetical protein